MAKTLEKQEEKVEQWLVREFSGLKTIKELLEELKSGIQSGKLDKRKIEKKVNKIISKEHWENRIEYRMERAFEQLISLLGATLNELKQKMPEQAQRIEEEKVKMQVYASNLIKILGRGGELDDMLKEAKKDVSALDKSMELVNKAIQSDQALLQEIKIFDNAVKVVESKDEYAPLYKDPTQEKLHDLIRGTGYYKKYSRAQRNKIWDKWIKVTPTRILFNFSAPNSELIGFNFIDFTFKGRTNLKGAIFAGASLTMASFRNANLEETNLRGAHLQRANLTGARLQRADLKEADLREAHLGGADLREANLKGADLKGAWLQGAWLQGADLKGANLEGANLEGANINGANIVGANIQGADLKDVKGMVQFRLAKNWERATNVPSRFH